MKWKANSGFRAYLHSHKVMKISTLFCMRPFKKYRKSPNIVSSAKRFWLSMTIPSMFLPYNQFYNNYKDLASPSSLILPTTEKKGYSNWSKSFKDVAKNPTS
jgi:hypothetical protein